MKQFTSPKLAWEPTPKLSQDSQARLIAGALRRLTATFAPDEEPETLEMLQMVFQAETRTELLAAAQRAGVNLLLSDGATPTDRRCAASSPEPAPRYRNSRLPGRAG